MLFKKFSLLGDFIILQTCSCMKNILQFLYLLQRAYLRVQGIYFNRILNKRRMTCTWIQSSAYSIRLIIPSQLLSLKYVFLLVLIIITFSDAFSRLWSYSVQYLSAVRSIIIVSVNEYTSIWPQNLSKLTPCEGFWEKKKVCVSVSMQRFFFLS